MSRKEVSEKEEPSQRNGKNIVRDRLAQEVWSGRTVFGSRKERKEP
jgi:hypothetical protein